MNKLFLAVSMVLVSACSPVKESITNQYGLESWAVAHKINRQQLTLYVSPTEAVAGLTTEEMRYTEKPYELRSFAHNAWYSPPADMLAPLMVKSLQSSGFFKVVTFISNADTADYRLDTQLMMLRQNFLKTPSQMDFTVKAVLTNVAQNRMVASKIMEYHIKCKEKTPFGGVIAANQATKRFTAELTDFIIQHL